MKDLKRCFYRTAFCLILLTDPAALLKAQNNSGKEKSFKFNQLLESGNREEAQRFLSGWSKSDGSSPELLFAYARFYASGKNYRLALVFLQQAIEKHTSAGYDYWFLLGEIQQKTNFFTEAEQAYAEALARTEDKSAAEERIRQCRISAALKDNPVEVRISSAGNTVNSAEDERRPFPDENLSEMHFSRTSPGKASILQASGNRGLWEKSQDFPLKKFPSYPDLKLSFYSGSSGELILETSAGRGDLCISGFSKGKWSDPKPFAWNSPGSGEYSASLSPDGKLLFFVSDRAGNPDIWFCRKKGNSWSRPEKAGPEINTPQAEESPFFDGVYLYFSSRGLDGLGGMDVFRIEFEKKKVKAENLGYPINTAADDLDFIMAGDGKTSYYASNREGGQVGFNIYAIRYGFALPVRLPPAILPAGSGIRPDPSSAKSGKKETNTVSPSEEASNTGASARPVQTVFFKGTVSDAWGAPLNAVINITEVGQKKPIASVMANKETGTFIARLPMGKSYSVQVEKEGFLFHSDLLDFLDAGSEQDLDRKIKLQKLIPNTALSLNNIFFDPGKSSLRKESSNELQKLLLILRQNPGLKAEISGHIEAGGPEEILMKLTEDRARAVVDYLVATGIKSTRLVPRGYGSSKSASKNGTSPGARIEFKVLSMQ